MKESRALKMSKKDANLGAGFQLIVPNDQNSLFGRLYALKQQPEVTETEIVLVQSREIFPAIESIR